MKIPVAVSVFVLAVMVHKTNGLCNTCSALTGLACISPTQFTICDEGTINPAPSVSTCPAGTFCTGTAEICSGTVATSCAKCKQCIVGNPYACNNYTSFSFCNGATMDPNVYPCPTGLVCSLDTPSICSDPTITGIGATCPSPASIPTTTPVPTVNPTTNPNGFCSAQGGVGRYEVLSDTTCRKFISCVSSAGIVTGNVYLCPKTTYFNKTSQTCGTTVPARCSGLF